MKLEEKNNRSGWVRIKLGPASSALSTAQLEEAAFRAGRGEAAAARRFFLIYLPRICLELRAAGLRGGHLLGAIRLLQDEIFKDPVKWKNNFQGRIKIEILPDHRLAGSRGFTEDPPPRGRRRENTFTFFLVRAGV